MKNLKRLYLPNTAVTDAGIAKLGGVKSLKTIYLWQTEVTPKGATALEKKVPGIKVNVGWSEADNAAVVAKADPPTPKEEAKAKEIADAEAAVAKANKAAADARKAAAAAKKKADEAKKKLDVLKK